MKKSLIFKSLIVLFSIISFVSCETEPLDPELDLSDFQNPTDSNNPNNPNNQFVFTASIDGQNWVADDAYAQVGPNLIVINGDRGVNGESFQFLIDGSTIGSFPAKDHLITFVPDNSDYGWFAFNDEDPDENTGTVTITEIDTQNKTISGTFSFKGYWSDSDVTNIPPKNFTNGVFTDIPYQAYEDPSNNTFFAKVNGTEFVETEILAVTLNGVIGLGAANATQQSITLGVNEDIIPGTYPITGNVGTDQVQASYKLNGTTTISASSGSVTITSITADRVVGTFSFVAVNGGTTYNVTEGAFDIEY